MSMGRRQWLQKDLELSDARIRELVLGLTDAQRAVPLVAGINPPIWELGHSAFFYEVFILRALYGVSPIMPGYDEVWDSFEIPHSARWQQDVVPDLAATLAYYENVIGQIRDRLYDDRPLSDRELYLFQYAIAHQNMHLESLLWLRQTLGYPAPDFVGNWSGESEVLTSGDVVIASGSYRIGLPKPGNEVEMTQPFGFDNEKPAFQIQLDEFAISRTLVTNREFLEFVDAGGYQKEDLWGLGGCHWLRKSQVTAPGYWEKRDGEWGVRRFDRWEPLRMEAPVMHVSSREANAFCNWAGRRLPSEFEWEVAASGAEGSSSDLEGRFGGTAPAGGLSETASDHGCLQMIGTAWEWTDSQYLPYAGFELDMYVYMSTLQFGDHKTTKGGSWATSRSLIRPTYRQAYLPGRRDVFVGFRTCAE